MKNQPLKWANKLLNWISSNKHLEVLQGDIYELFQANIKRYGNTKAKLLFIWDVLSMVPYAIKRRKTKLKSNSTDMLKHYLLSTIRSFKKNKLYTMINLSGLILGLTSCFLILQYTHHEMSYDNFHEKKHNIYRLQQTESSKERVLEGVCLAGALGPLFYENLPEVNDYVQLRRGNSVITYKNNVYTEKRAYYSTPSFFQMFSYDLLKGSKSSVLKDPYSMVISESTAKKFFGNEDPMGKTMNRDGRQDFVVTGVFKDPPENTHLKADILYSMETLIKIYGEKEVNNLDWWSYWTYFELNEGINITDFEQKIAGMINQQFGEMLKEFNVQEVFRLQPIEKIHLYSNFPDELEVNGNATIILGLQVIAAFILIIAWLNFISLSTARSMHRAREIGIRKVMGSNRRQLIMQFLCESWVLNIIAASVAIGLSFLLQPYFEHVIAKRLVANLFLNQKFQIVFPLVLMLGAFLSGLYPALVLSSYKPIATLKGHFKASTKGQIIRKSIVVFQFMISAILIASTLIVYKQIQYMQKKDLGIEIDQMIILNSPIIADSTYLTKYQSFKTELLRLSTIKGVSVSSNTPGNSVLMNQAGGVRREGVPKKDGLIFKIIDIDYDFVPLFKVEILAGRNFLKQRDTTSPPILINEKGIEQLGFKDADDAIGQKITFWNQTHEIIGILKNYHQDSPKSDYKSTIFRPLWDNWAGQYSIKVEHQNLMSTLASINKVFDELFPGNPFDFSFLDTQYQQQYESDKIFNSLFGFFSGLAIFIACIGLLGLSAYTVFQKMKEVGIRKVLGASLNQIVLLLSADFSKLILSASLLGAPIAYYLMNEWLQNFAFRINMNWTTFIIPVMVLFGLAILTISFQVLKAANTNPVETLKDE